MFCNNLYFHTGCDLSWHCKCPVELSRFPCKVLKNPSLEDEEDEDDAYIHFSPVSKLSLEERIFYFLAGATRQQDERYLIFWFDFQEGSWP